MDAGLAFGIVLTALVIVVAWWVQSNRKKNAELIKLQGEKESWRAKAVDFEYALKAIMRAMQLGVDPTRDLNDLEKHGNEFPEEVMYFLRRAGELVYLVRALPMALKELETKHTTGAVNGDVARAWNMSCNLGHYLDAIPVLTGMQEGELWEQLQEYRRLGQIAEVKRFLDADLSNTGLALQRVQRAREYMDEHKVPRTSLTDDECALLDAAEDVAVNTETFMSRLRVFKTVATQAESVVDDAK